MNVINIMDGYTKWDELCPFIKKELGLDYSHRGVHPDHNGLSVNGRLPYSISESEFNFIKDYIIKHDLKRGFDLATGTGISAIAAGWALKQTGGKLLSIDSYMEEKTQGQSHEPIPGQERPTLGNDAPYENNKNLMTLFGLENVYLEMGIAPNDCISYIEKHQITPIDFAFLDCPKDGEQFIRDASYIREYLNHDKFAIFWHDTHNFMEEFRNLSMEFFNVESIQITDFTFLGETVQQKYPLSLITNIIK